MKRLDRFLRLRAARKTRQSTEQKDSRWTRERSTDLRFARAQYAAYCRGEGDFNG